MGKYLAAEHEQREHKTVGQKRQLCHHRKLCGKQVQRRYRACHDQVPVVPQMFQPPQVGGIGGDHGREEEHGIKQGVLGPQAIPAVGEDLKILQIIESAVGGGKNGQHKEHCPDRGMRGVCGSPQEYSVSAWFYTSSSCTLRHARVNSTAPSARVKASSPQLKGRVPKVTVWVALFQFATS